jgi:hypothetical protein
MDDEMREHQEKEEPGDSRSLVLSGTSPIQVKFIGWLVVVCAGGFGGWIWWAATMSSKLDTVISNQAAASAATRAVEGDVARLKEWRVQVDTVGSPQMVKRVDQLSQEMEAIRREFDMHKATTMKP